MPFGMKINVKGNKIWLKLRVYRQVPRKPRLACPVKCEAYLARGGGDESAQFINNQI